MSLTLEEWVNPPVAAAVVTAGGTDAPTSGTSESWTLGGGYTSFPTASNSAAQPNTFHIYDPLFPGELIAVTLTSGSAWTVTRGAEGSTPVLHSPPFTVLNAVTAGSLGKLLQGIAGSDGQVTVAYAASGLLVCALAPRAATGGDALGSSWSAGYTGPVQAIHPSSNPATAETWTTISNPSGWSGAIRVRLLAELNMCFLDLRCTFTALGSKTSTTITSSWPTAYRPANSQTLPAVETNNSAAAAPQPSVYVGSGGTTTAYNLDTGTTGLDCHCAYYLS